MKISERYKKTKVREDVETTTHIDVETGEVLSSEQVLKQKHVKQVTQESFIFAFLEDMKGLLKIENKSEIRVLACLWQMSSFNAPGETTGNEITLLPRERNWIAEQVGIKAGTVKNVVKALVEKELIFRVERSRYRLNPEYFWKGYLQDRAKVLEMTVKYEIVEEGLNGKDINGFRKENGNSEEIQGNSESGK